MPPITTSIRHPEADTTVKRHFIAQGTCKDNTKVSGFVKKGGGQQIDGIPMPSSKKKQWGLLFKAVPPGNYNLTVKEDGGNPSSQTIPIRVTSAFAVVPLDIWYPQDNDPVDLVFYPYGVSDYEIAYIWFSDYPRYEIYGAVLGQVDAISEFWFGMVDNPVDPGGGPDLDYDLEVRNIDSDLLASTKMRNGLTLP
jgi:hypothetical protein